MKLHLLEDLLGLNQTFEQALRGLEPMVRTSLFYGEESRYPPANVDGRALCGSF